jgi:ATP-binding cassette, subfamily F, member 3
MLDLMLKKIPGVKEPVVRAKLGQFGFSRDLADNRIAKLSGGEKARLLFAFMSFDAPHLLLLDEPTNHLDIDAREALVQALNAYEGAVVIVSHDPTMVERVADRLWLVQDGACRDFDGDLEDYRKFTIAAKREQRREEKSRKERAEAPAASEDEEMPAINGKKQLRQAAEIEKKVAALTRQKEDLEARMAAPSFYTDGKKIAESKREYDRVVSELSELENLWLAGHG